MKKISFFFAILLLLSTNYVNAEGFAGAIFTTDSVCDGTNVNIFADKSDVYVDGGPQHEGSASLPDGVYAIKVTEPDGTVLGTSAGLTNETPIVVSGGAFVDCYNLENVVLKASDANPGYDTTTNGGGEYKVWVCTDTTFDSCKTDNFKVAKEENPDPTGNISGMKWDDINANATFGTEEVGISNWSINLYESDGTTLVFGTTTDIDGNYSFSDLSLGDYKVCEVQQIGWARAYPVNSDCQDITISLDILDQQNINFGNYRLSTIIIKKVTNPAGDTQSFDFSVTGTNFNNNFSIHDGEESSMYVLPGQAFSASEAVPFGWIQTSASCDNGNSVSSITTNIGQTVTCTFNNMKLGKLYVTKHVVNDNNGLKVAGDFTMNITGNSPSLTTFPGSEDGVSVLLQPGDYTADESLDTGYSKTLSAECAGTINPGEVKYCTITNNDIAITRTQGFWSTHTAFTNGVFVNFSLSPKGLIDNITSTKKSKLYGAYFSNISKKTNGVTRSALDRARMILLQQLVTAKLNCTAFICTTATLADIASADSAYASMNTSNILAYASLLDIYNNSGDSQPFLPSQNPGSATPKTSQGYADLAFWN